ncbi:MAG TPA: AAA family ATPase [Polyangiaceae bacterium]|nr:AAA family ATPase [Polyangiaceae bacterium]
MAIAQLQIDDYSAAETLSVSARSVVRRARSSDGSSVILKSFNQGQTTPEQRKELERELDILRQLAVPEIATAYEVCEIGGQPTLVLEDCGGRVLSIPEGGIEVGLCLELAVQVARALARVHECGLIHNDVNPDNILVDPETRKLKLIDFHLASRHNSSDSAVGATGSLAYIAPERTGRVNRRPDQRADYYSFGITLFQWLTGRLPFSASDGLGWAHLHLSKQAPLASELNHGVPQLLAELVAKLMAKNPDQRYQGSYGLLSDLITLRDAWSKFREIPQFELGSRDISGDFQVSHETVGRDGELGTVSAVLERVRSGATGLLLVPGAPGVGKSALLGELARRANDAELFLLSGTFGKQSLNIPFSGLVQALRGLVAELLSRSEEELADFKRQILAALRPNAAIMTDLVPELVRVIGPQASVAQLNPIETQHRLQHVLCSFIGVFARVERPLLLVLDDGQWMDTSTAEALSEILASPDSSHVLILAAFRDSEVSPEHPLVKLRDAVQRGAPESVHTLQLGPLDSQSVARLVANTLRTTVAEVSEIAELVHKKTDGNPFFVGELLASFHRQGILSLDLEHGRWRQDLERARACQVSDNVGASIAEQLDRISPAAAELLSAAACIGVRFELSTLAAVAELDAETCSALIWETVSQRLLVPVESGADLEPDGSSEEVPAAGLRSYAFQHARVQQAAAARLSDARRATLHLRIGRWLELHTPEDSARTHIFDVLQHLNLARASLTEPGARLSLTELNLTASTQAVQTGAPEIAEAHAQIAVELLGPAERALAPELAFRAHSARAQAVFQLGKSVQAEALCAELFELAPDGLSRARAHLLKARILEHQGRLLEAVAEIRAGVTGLGVVLPESPELIGQGIAEGIAKMQAHLARVQVEDLALLPEAESAETRMVLSLLEQLIPPAIQTNPPLFILAELLMFDLALVKGVSPASCKNFVDCGILQAAMLNNHDVAYRLGKAAFRLLERYAPTPFESGVSFVFAAFVSHWRRPYREGFDAYDRAEKSGVELGDLQHVAYALTHRTQRSFSTGKHLPDCQSELIAARSYLTRIRATGQLVGSLVPERACARLLSVPADAEAVAHADAEALATVLASKNAQWAYSFGQAQVMTSFILGDFESASKWQAFTKPYSSSSASLFSVPDYHLFEALLELRHAGEGSEQERVERLKLVDQTVQKLRTWSDACPENFAHKYHLLLAERARALGEPLQVILDGYRTAVKSAADGFPQFRALTLEREAELWLDLNETRHARTCIEAAYRLYEGWGATAKLEILERKYPAWLASGLPSDLLQRNSDQPPSAGHRRGALDAASILKATQSISSEVHPHKLFTALMTTLIESAGAQRGCLILKDDTTEHYYVEARADVESPGANLAEREPLASNPASVCASIVRYVLRSREAVTLDDAGVLGAFQSDAYIKRETVRSVLCAPILRQGEILGVLYLENNLTSHAFTKERLAILQVIASQAAISIHNAQLYERLEQRVALRTEQLAFKNRQVASMLDNMDLGVFTIDETLNIQPEYSRYLAQILGTDEIVGKNCVDLLFGGADLRPDAVVACTAALQFSFGVEAWLAEANSQHLITEMHKFAPDGQLRYFEISWNLICNDAALVERVLVTVRDVTLVRSLKQVAREKERESDIIAQVLDSGLQAFEEFAALSKRLLTENELALAGEAAPSAESVAVAFRHLHTLKGNARLRGFSHLVDGLHAAEDAYDSVRRDPSACLDTRELLGQLQAVRSLVEHYEDVCHRKLAQLAKRRQTAPEQALQEIATLLDDASTPDRVAELVPRIRASLAELRGINLSELIEETGRFLPSLARELGKPEPKILARVANHRLLPEWSSVLRDVLVQCFRNSLYHGIEMPALRELASKQTHGQIEVRVRPRSDAFEIEVCDDGAGLALDALRSPAQHLLDDESLAERIFQSGLSTAQNIGQVAGRGVGLDIVRSNLRERGGDAFVRFTGESKQGRRPFALVLVLPAKAVAARAEARALA